MIYNGHDMRHFRVMRDTTEWRGYMCARCLYQRFGLPGACLNLDELPECSQATFDDAPPEIPEATPKADGPFTRAELKGLIARADSMRSGTFDDRKIRRFEDLVRALEAADDLLARKVLEALNG